MTSSRDLLGVKFSPAFGVMTIPGRIESAAIVADRLVDMRKVFGQRRNTAQVGGLTVNPEQVRSALGPFLVIQSTQSNVFDAMGIGLMLGLRTGDSSAFNDGLGAMVDPNARMLAAGLRDGAPLPEGTVPTDLTTTRSKWGWVLLASLSYLEHGN